MAQSWANKCVFQHSGGNAGENLYMQTNNVAVCRFWMWKGLYFENSWIKAYWDMGYKDPRGAGLYQAYGVFEPGPIRLLNSNRVYGALELL